MNITVEEVEGLYRRACVARHSLLASLAGYLAGAAALAARYVPGNHLFSAAGLGLWIYVFELICSLFFSCLGCTAVVLPLAGTHRIGRWTDRAWFIALLGGLIGVVMLAPLYRLFTEPGQGLASPMVRAYGVSAFVNAATASWTCVYLRRRHQQRFSEWRLRQTVGE
jgi:hypothetical protein